MKFVEKNGRKWSSKRAYNHYVSNIKKYMNLYFELENYADDTDNNFIFEDEGFKILFKIWDDKIDKQMTEQELLKTTDFIVERLLKVIEKVGKDNFVILKNGDLDYIWKYKARG